MIVEIGIAAGNVAADKLIKKYRNVPTLDKYRQLDTSKKYQNVKVLTEDDLQHVSEYFGTPVFMPITFQQIQYKDYWTKNTVRVAELKVSAAIVTVNWTKEIIKTAVQAQHRPGTFQEYINLGDYAITIDGLLSDDNGKYPLKKVQWLHDIGTAPVQVEVEHKLLNALGIYDLVIESGGLQPKPQVQDLQPFRLDCISTYPVDLILKNEKEAKKV